MKTFLLALLRNCLRLKIPRSVMMDSHCTMLWLYPLIAVAGMGLCQLSYGI